MSGEESFGLCGGEGSVRLQTFWLRPTGGDAALFSAVVQEVAVPQPGLYALTACYILDGQYFEVSINQGKRVLSKTAVTSSTNTTAIISNTVQITDTATPIHVVFRLTGEGRAWLDDAVLQRTDR